MRTMKLATIAACAALAGCAVEQPTVRQGNYARLPLTPAQEQIAQDADLSMTALFAQDCQWYQLATPDTRARIQQIRRDADARVTASDAATRGNAVEQGVTRAPPHGDGNPVFCGYAQRLIDAALLRERSTNRRTRQP